MMDFLSSVVQEMLRVFYGLTSSLGVPSYGLAIIFMTIVVKVLLYPVTKKQLESMKAMNELKPKMDKIREKYKDDKERLNMELANLYKNEGVNPLSGCLPLLIQMPIMIGIFYGIRDFEYVGSSNFLIWDIAKSFKDINGALGFGAAVPYLILPVLSALTTYITSKQTTPAGDAGAQMKMMSTMMPLFIGYISIDFPSGLVLYWVVMNIMQIIQQIIMDKAAGK